MIRSTILLRIKSKRILAHSQYWIFQVPESEIGEFLSAREHLKKDSNDCDDISLSIAGNRYYAREITSGLLLVFIADVDENEETVNAKISTAANVFHEIIERKKIAYVKANYEMLVNPFVHSKLRIALVGEDSVGKTTTLHLIMGRRPPLQYIPALALTMQVIEIIHFANYSLVLWDFAGQERFRTLWKLYFQGADIVFLLTDSTLPNLSVSKEMFQMICRDAPHVPIIVIANKQDLPNALDPSIIERIIGAKTYPLVAIDMAYRDDILKLLLNTVAKHVNIPLPKLPTEELLRFTAEEEYEKR